MLKYIKNNLETIDGVEIYPIISLVLFFLVFSLMIVFVFKLPKRRIDNLSNLPFENDTNTKDETHE